MRKWGASEEIIREKLGLNDSECEPNCVTVYVLEENMESARVFQYCQPQMFAGMTSFVWTGIQSVEIKATCELLLVKQENWPKVTEDVHFMGMIAARLNNQSSSRNRR